MNEAELKRLDEEIKTAKIGSAIHFGLTQERARELRDPLSGEIRSEAIKKRVAEEDMFFGFSYDQRETSAIYKLKTMLDSSPDISWESRLKASKYAYDTYKKDADEAAIEYGKQNAEGHAKAIKENERFIKATPWRQLRKNNPINEPVKRKEGSA